MTRLEETGALFVLLAAVAVLGVVALVGHPTPADAQAEPLIVGTFPEQGGVALVSTTADAVPPQLVGAAQFGGCDPQSLFIAQGGQLLAFVVGAPSFVNATFPPLVAEGTSLLLYCEPTPSPIPVTLPLAAAPGLSCPVFPQDNIWNTRVDDLPVHAWSSAWVASIGVFANAHPDFGSGEWPPGSGAPIGIPYIEVDGGTSVDVAFGYASESDPGPYPIPSNAPIEGGPNADGDRHVLVVDRSDCTLYELFDARRQPDGSWTAGSGATFDLNSNDLRTAGWTSADAAGLPILPGLIRYDEVATGEITHAIRFTAPQTQRAFVWPATHFASNLEGDEYPPMGARFRLRADFDLAGYDPDVQVILRAMQQYGLLLADNGSPWFLSGAPDERWDNTVLRELKDLRGSDFEAVDASSLQATAGSGAVQP